MQNLNSFYTTLLDNLKFSEVDDEINQLIQQIEVYKEKIKTEEKNFELYESLRSSNNQLQLENDEMKVFLMLHYPHRNLQDELEYLGNCIDFMRQVLEEINDNEDSKDVYEKYKENIDQIMQMNVETLTEFDLDNPELALNRSLTIENNNENNQEPQDRVPLDLNESVELAKEEDIESAMALFNVLNLEAYS